MIGKATNPTIPSSHKVVFNNGYTINDEVFRLFSRGVAGENSGGALANITAGEFESTRLSSGPHTPGEVGDAQAAGFAKFEAWVHPAQKRVSERQAYLADRAATVDAAKPLAGAIENDIGPLKYWGRAYYRIGSIIGIDDQDEVQAELDLANYFASRHEPSITMTQATARTQGNVVKAANVAFAAASLGATAPAVSGLADAQLVDYGSTELSQFAQAFRQEQGVFTARNVSVFEYQSEGGVVSRIAGFSQKGLGGGHAERLIARELESLGVSPGRVSQIYSEFEPCSIPGGMCKNFIARTFPNAQVSYSFEYGATEASRRAGKKALQMSLKFLEE